MVWAGGLALVMTAGWPAGAATSAWEPVAVAVLVSAGATDDGTRSGQALREFCLLYTSPSPRDGLLSRMPSSA